MKGKWKKYFDIYGFDLFFIGCLLFSLISLASSIFILDLLLIASGLFALPVFIYLLFKPFSYNPRTTFIKISHKPSNLRLVFITDLHFHEFMPKNYYKKAFEKINTLKPTAILFGGDFVHDRNTNFRQLEELRILNAKHKIGILGNHDYDIRKGDFQKDLIRTENFKYGDLVEKELEKNGITILRNENFEIGGVNVFGLDSLWAKKNDLSKYKPGEFNIILAHNPRLVEEMNEVNAKGVNFVLCGHNHGGGQIRLNKWISAHVLMGLIQPIWFKAFGRWVSGSYKNKAGIKMFLNRGLGVTGISARINCPPEITIIDIK
ncbi:metallophosphoesterase [Candidatus Dojkabacteria bacterium]|nr:metallophosphoesterase [Candidatus Dojkabacteria bacterium]